MHDDYRETLTDTGKTIEHKGRTFQIWTTTDQRADSPYVLRPASGRGGDYILLRNKPNPAHLFGIKAEGMKIMPGWFRETAPGEIKSLG